MDQDIIRRSVVAVCTRIPDDAFTARTLGTAREGSGVVIPGDGLVLTIGYLLTEAEEVRLTTYDGRLVPGHALAYDQETGFGLIQAFDKLDCPALYFANTVSAKLGDAVLAVDGFGQSTQAQLVAKQEFAGYWEYLLEEALFTAPAHPYWGGAAFVDQDGALLGLARSSWR